MVDKILDARAVGPELWVVHWTVGAAIEEGRIVKETAQKVGAGAQGVGSW